MTKNSLRLVVFAAFAIFFLIVNLKSVFAVDFNDWQIGGLSGDYDCAGFWSSTTLETWISPGDGWSYERGGNVRVAGKFRFYTYANVGCIQNHSFRYRYDVKFDGTNLIQDYIWPDNAVTVPVGGGLWYHEFTLDNTVQVPGGASIGSHQIGYVLRHYYNGGVWLQVRAATAYASINVNSPPGPSPTPGASPSPSSPPGAINITSATANCNVDGYPNVRLTWTSGTGDSNYIIGRWPAYAEGGEKNGYNSPFNSTYNFTVGFNETSYWVVKSNINPSIEDGRSVTTPASCGGNPSPTPPGPLPDLSTGLRIHHASDNQYVTASYPAVPGETLRARVVLENNGDGNAGAFRISLWENRNPQPANCSGGSSSQYQNYGSLDAYESVNDSYTFTAPGTDGTYTAWHYIDSLCQVAEPDPNEWVTNMQSRLYYVASGPPKTDVIVTIFFDKNSNGRNDAGEQFASGGNPNWNSSIGSLTVNGTPFTTIVANGTGLTNDAATSGQPVNATLSLAAGWSGTLWTYTFNDCTGSSCVPISWEENLTYTSPNYTAVTPAVPASFDTNDSVLFTFGINQLPPTAPTSLSAVPGCTGSYQPQITFNWDDVAGETSYELQVTTDPSWVSSFGYISVPAASGGQVTYPWDTQTLDGGPPTTIANNTTYYWRVLARNLAGDSPYAYALDSVTTNCEAPDIDWNDVGVSIELFKDNWTVSSNSFEEGESIYVRVNVNNLVNNGGDSPGFDVGFYLNPTAAPDCSDFPDEQMNIGPIGAGGSPSLPSWDFIATAPAIGADPSKTAYAFADWQCAVVEGDEDNNIAPRSYTINVDAWFETTGGDVGSAGAITTEILPASGDYNSEYLLASGTNQWQVTSENNWIITSYDPHRLIPTGTVYDYLASRFLEEAKVAHSGACSLTDLTEGLNYCDTAGTPINISGTQTVSNAVWFIDGDLIVIGNLTVGTSNTLTFVVSGDITINTGVDQADGIYIAQGDFTDTDASGTFGPQLTINGAVYANQVNLTRVLSSEPAVCGTICDNALYPAEVINFQPKYLVALAGDDYLGSPAISWREVAP